MTFVEQQLRGKFGDDAVELVESEGTVKQNLLKLKITVPVAGSVTILMTNGLSNHRMKVHEKYAGKEYNEIFFCLPDYWDFENPAGKWVFPMLEKLSSFVIEKDTWFGPGHTIPNGNPPVVFSEIMKQSFLVLDNPILLQKELAPLESPDGNKIHFLALIPVFKDEFDYKTSKGMYKLQSKFREKGVNELLDMYRLSVIRGKWKLFPF